MAGAHIHPGTRRFALQPSAIGGAEIDPAEFTHAEGRVGAMARRAAEMRLAVEQHHALDAVPAQLHGRRDARRAAADDIRVAHASYRSSTASGVARRLRVIAARRALQ